MQTEPVSETTLDLIYDLGDRFSGKLEPIERYLASMAGAESDTETAELLLRASTALLEHRPRDAVDILNYGQRRAVSNRAMTLAIGEIKLHLRDNTCVEQFDFLSTQSPAKFAGLFTAAARLMAGDIDRAAAALNKALRHYMVPPGASVRDVAGQIADQSEAQGWCGFGDAGTLHIGGKAHALGAAEITVLLDDKPIRLGDADIRIADGYTEVILPDLWHLAKSISVFNKRLPLIGSPIVVADALAHISTIWLDRGRICGKSWYPGRPLMSPSVVLVDAEDGKILSDRPERVAADDADYASLQFQRHFQFDLTSDMHHLDAFAVRDSYGRIFVGSPIRPFHQIKTNRTLVCAIAARYPAGADAEGNEAAAGIPALSDFSLVPDFPGLPPETTPFVARDPLVVIPVYRGLEVTLACIDSVRKHSAASVEILAVVDDSPDHELVARLKKLGQSRKITLILKPRNEGFPATANVGLRAAIDRGRDVILLNSDTIVTDGWIERLQRPLLSDPTIGTITPLSNAASILSFPSTKTVNAIPTSREADEIAALAYAVNGDTTVEMPTAHGFCMYIRRDCLVQTGVLRQDVFGLGYGEENDFSLRASHLGWKHVAATGSYIGHIESQSFTDSKTFLLERNLKRLNRLHPGYDQMIADWVKADALQPFRSRLLIALWKKRLADRETIVLVTHNRDGGVQKFIDYRAGLARDAGKFVLVMRPGKNQKTDQVGYLEDYFSPRKDKLTLDLSGEGNPFSLTFEDLAVASIELHHTIGWSSEVIAHVLQAAKCYDMFIHDYSWFCPRITLTTGENRYCGEPPVEACEACVGEYGSTIDEVISARSLIDRSQAILAGADNVFVPSVDVSRRMARRFAVKPRVAQWEKGTSIPATLKSVESSKGGKRRICVVGAIGQEKGFKILLDAARWVQRKGLDIEFRIVGYTCNDRALLETGCVYITGGYQEAEVISLIKAQDAAFAFFPAVWPETWSFVLSQCWEANLPVLAFDIGAPAERIRQTGGGGLIPLGLPISRLVESMLRFHSNQEELGLDMAG
ncbi:glycosyltransferase [Acidisoma silvae]|nr:glycosyltransferase [Acidisoma silvae]